MIVFLDAHLLNKVYLFLFGLLFSLLQRLLLGFCLDYRQKSIPKLSSTGFIKSELNLSFTKSVVELKASISFKRDGIFYFFNLGFLGTIQKSWRCISWEVVQSDYFHPVYALLHVSHFETLASLPYSLHTVKFLRNQMFNIVVL